MLLLYTWKGNDGRLYFLYCCDSFYFNLWQIIDLYLIHICFKSHLNLKLHSTDVLFRLFYTISYIEILGNIFSIWVNTNTRVLICDWLKSIITGSFVGPRRLQSFVFSVCVLRNVNVSWIYLDKSNLEELYVLDEICYLIKKNLLKLLNRFEETSITNH